VPASVALAEAIRVALVQSFLNPSCVVYMLSQSDYLGASSTTFRAAITARECIGFVLRIEAVRRSCALGCLVKRPGAMLRAGAAGNDWRTFLASQKHTAWPGVFSPKPSPIELGMACRGGQ
jgi:hypothetical protein